MLAFSGSLIVGTMSRAAHADPPRPTERYWYGYQTLIADGVSAAVFVTGGAAGSAPIALVGFGGLVVGAPIVHAANGEGTAALSSLGVRLLLPTLGAVVGYGLAGSCHDKPKAGDFLGPCFMHGFDEAAIGGLIGLSAAVALDAAVFARGVRPARDSADRDTGPRITSIAPSYDPKSATTSLGLMGVF